MFKKIRVTILLLILVVAVTERWRAYHRTDWSSSLYVALYPINGDNSPAAADYIQKLSIADFGEIGEFFDEEAKRHDFNMFHPIELFLGPQVMEMPPHPPPPDGPRLDIVWWSLKFRWWAFQHGDIPGVKPDVRLFMVYVDPAQHVQAENSLALRETMAGIANLYGVSAKHKQNAVVIAHELLHTLGATDKYDPQTHYPRYPDGFAQPDAQPPLPQQWAELMAGRMPVTSVEAEIPASLRNTLIGVSTAVEIGWVK